MEKRLQDGRGLESSLPGLTRQSIKLSKAFFKTDAPIKSAHDNL
jgi:hypothetical protein